MEAKENRETRGFLVCRCRRCGEKFEEIRTASTVFLRCGCPREPSEILRDYVYNEPQPVLRYPDTNFRCSPTSPGVLSKLIAGKMDPASFFDAVRAGSEFHSHIYKEGRARYYEGNANSVAYGLDAHDQLTRQHHQAKVSNANLLRPSNTEPPTVSSVGEVD